MAILVPFDSLPGLEISAEDYVVFGGTFDPIHIGHVSDIKRLRTFFPSVLIAPTDQNPWKEVAPSEIGLRIEMIRLVLTAEGIREDQQKLEILNDGYIYAADLVRSLRERRPGRLFWAVGEDIAPTVKGWKDWESLAVQTIVLPFEVPLSATDIRAGRAPLHPAVQDFARLHKLYER